MKPNHTLSAVADRKTVTEYPLRVAVCDDETEALADTAGRVGKLLKSLRVPCSILCFSSGDALLDSDSDFDMLFLDIRMEGRNGMETALCLRQRGFQGILIFLTVLEEYVFDAFAAEAFDYLLKPLDGGRLEAVVSRALSRLDAGRFLSLSDASRCSVHQSGPDAGAVFGTGGPAGGRPASGCSDSGQPCGGGCPDSGRPGGGRCSDSGRPGAECPDSGRPGSDSGRPGTLLIRRSNTCRLLPVGDIVYCEAIARKIYLHTCSRETIDYYARIGTLEQQLGSAFFRCHRSYLLHLRYVECCEPGFARLTTGDAVPISRLRSHDFSQALLQYLEDQSRPFPVPAQHN